MQEIPLTKGYVAFVDDEDHPHVSQFNWYARVRRRKDGIIKNVYAARDIRKNRKLTTVHLHRFIVGVSDPSVQIDHEDHNGLNNQKHNLRIATQTQNMGNSRKRLSPTSSQFKGVSWDKNAGKWRAYVRINKQLKYLGIFSSEITAAHAYDSKAQELFGEFAFTNLQKAQ